MITTTLPPGCLQVPCGGWRRPSAAAVAGPDDLAFCFARDAALYAHVR